MRFAHGIAVSQSCEASSKRQGDGQRIQKKAMKTTNQIEASAPASVRPSSVSKTSNSEQLHRIDFRQRFTIADFRQRKFWTCSTVKPRAARFCLTKKRSRICHSNYGFFLPRGWIKTDSFRMAAVPRGTKRPTCSSHPGSLTDKPGRAQMGRFYQTNPSF